MSDPLSDDDWDDNVLFGSELSDREIYLIGKIVLSWGELEHEIFWQTFDHFNPTSLDELPREMHNLNSSEVLKLWKKHVVDTSEGKRRAVLQNVYSKIEQLAPYRNAIVHGTWDWAPSEPERIEVSRIRKDKLVSHSFTADELGQLSLLLSKMNFRIRYPGGFEEYAEDERNTSNCSYMSRKFVSIVKNRPSVNDWFGLRDVLKDNQSSPDEATDVLA
jgi:hypothetical protein